MWRLDHIAQSTTPFLVRQEGGELWRLTGANALAAAVTLWPLRLVLSDDLLGTCTALSYSEGHELCGCLDLVPLPAESLWIEGDEGIRRAALALGRVRTRTVELLWRVSYSSRKGARRSR